MKKLFKKAFTLVELLVVIAILATLSGITVIGYGSFKKQAAKKADAANVDDMNSYIRAYETLDTIDDYKELYNALLNDDSFDVNKLTAQTKNARFGYDTVHHKMGLFDISSGKAIYAPNYAEGASFGNEVYMTADNEASLKSAGSHLVVKDIELSEKVTFDHLSSIDMLDNANVVGNLEYVTTDAGNMNIKGSIVGDVTFNTPNAHVEQYGILDGTLTQTAVSSTTLVIDGYVSFLNVGEGSVKVEQDGVVREITNETDFALGTDCTFTNNGYIGFVPSVVATTNFVNEGFVGYENDALIGTYYTPTMNVKISTVEEFMKFSMMTQHHKSPYIAHNTNDILDYNVVNVELLNDINLRNTNYISIGSWDVSAYKAADRGGMSTVTAELSNKVSNVHINFDGKGHTLFMGCRSLFGTVGMGTKVHDLTLDFLYDSREIEDIHQKNLMTITFKNRVHFTQISNMDNKGLEWAPGQDPCHYGCVATMIDNYYSNKALMDAEDKIVFNNIVVNGSIIFDFAAPAFNGNFFIFNAYCGMGVGYSSHFEVTNCTNNVFSSNTSVSANCTIDYSKTNRGNRGYNISPNYMGDTDGLYILSLV